METGFLEGWAFKKTCLSLWLICLKLPCVFSPGAVEPGCPRKPWEAKAATFEVEEETGLGLFPAFLA